jgi:Rrf2 family protein
MDVLKRNTDYALRAMVHLARLWPGNSASTRDIAAAEDVSYDLMCKLLQKLSKARLVKSTMGPRGGFRLAAEPKKIGVGQVIKSVQGPINLNRCLLAGYKCPRGDDCPVYEKLAELQKSIDGYFSKVTLADMLKTPRRHKRKRGKK